MKRIAILAALVAVAACNKSDKVNTTDTSTAGGAVAPASGDTTGSMSGMSSSSSTTMSSGSSTNSSSKMMDTSKMSDTSKMRDSTKSHMKGAARNQSQSGVTDSSGRSTLGPNVKKTSPTSGAPVTAKGDTLKKGQPSSTP